MKLKELTIGKEKKSLKSRNVSEKIFINTLFFICSFMVSHANFWGVFHPFGLSVAACAIDGNFFPLILGAVFGYFTVFQTSSGLRYVATTIAIAFIGWSFNDFKKLRKNPLFMSLIVFFPTLVTGLIINSISGFDVRDIFLSLIEAMVAAVSTIYFNGTIRFLCEFFKINCKIKIRDCDIVYFLFTVSTVLMSVSKVNIGFLSLGRIIASFIVIFSASNFGIFGGCLAGVITGVIFSFPNFSMNMIFFPFSLAGVVCGFLKSCNRFVQCLVFAVIALFLSFQGGNSSNSIILLYEITFGSVIFLCIPGSKKFRSLYVKNNFDNLKDTNNFSKSESLNGELDKFSKKILEIPKCLENVASELSMEGLSFVSRRQIAARLLNIKNNIEGELLVADIVLKSANNFIKESNKIPKKASISPKVSASQHSCKNGKFCGDSYLTFFDKSGDFSVILSDGMGTGSNAAADGAIVSELVKSLNLASVSCGDAIKLVNTAFEESLKSEESCVALDVLKIDCHNRKAKFIKAGAAPSFIKKSGKVQKINFSSLPIGILSETNFSEFEISLDPGDQILMMTDGVSDCGESWIFHEFLNWDGQNSKNFSQGIINKASQIRKASHDDDITAILIDI